MTLLAVALGAAALLFLPPTALESGAKRLVGPEFFTDLGTWSEGTERLGGLRFVRALAVAGLVVLALAGAAVLRLRGEPSPRGRAGAAEIAAFYAVVALGFSGNLALGTSWWDLHHPLYLGPRVGELVIGLAAIGVYPFIARHASSSRDAPALLVWGPAARAGATAAVGLALGFGLLSTVAHCCAMARGADCFYFFVFKLVVLGPTTFFLFGYGLPLLRSRFGPTASSAAAGAPLALLIPWHTAGFALLGAVEGVAMAELARRSGSFVPALLLYYLGYVFHAGLAWRPPGFALSVTLPLTLAVVCLLRRVR